MTAHSGSPLRIPSAVSPDKTFGSSASFRVVEAKSFPGALRAICASTCSMEIDSPAGKPSNVIPIASV